MEVDLELRNAALLAEFDAARALRKLTDIVQKLAQGGQWGVLTEVTELLCRIEDEATQYRRDAQHRLNRVTNDRYQELLDELKETQEAMEMQRGDDGD